MEDYQGKVVLLNFWATWCPSCISEMPSLDQLSMQLQGTPFQVLAISVDEEGWPAIDQFQTRIPLHFPVLLDTNGSVAAQYDVFELPQTFLLDKKGRVIKIYSGSRDWTDAALVSEIRRYFSAQ